MIAATAVLAACAVLFVLFGLLAPADRGGGCGACSGGTSACRTGCARERGAPSPADPDPAHPPTGSRS